MGMADTVRSEAISLMSLLERLTKPVVHKVE